MRSCLLLPWLLFAGCFAELAGGPGFALGGAQGIGWHLTVSAGAQYDFGSRVRVAVGGEAATVSVKGGEETFGRSGFGVNLMTDTALTDNDGLAVRLRLGAMVQPASRLSLSPSLTGRSYSAPSVGDGQGTKPATFFTGGALVGIGIDEVGGVFGWSFGINLRTQLTLSSWSGDVVTMTPELRVTGLLDLHGLLEWVGGVDFSSVKPVPRSSSSSSSSPNGWRENLEKKESDSQREIQRQSEQKVRNCQRGTGTCL